MPAETRTALRPIYRIMKGDQDITKMFNDRTVSIEAEITSGGGASDTFKITVDNRDFLIARPQTGAQIKIELGYDGFGMAELGQYEINELYFEGPPHSLRLVGTSAGMRATMRAPTIKNYENKTIGDIVQDIAKKGGVEARIDKSLSDIKLPFVNQFNSNFHLLHELERRFGAVVKFEFGKLVFTKRDDGESVEGASLPMLMLNPEHIATYSVKHTDRSAYSSVKAAYWDKDTHTRRYVESKNGALGDQMKEGEEDSPFIMNQMFNSQEEAKAAADARVQALQRATGEATIELAKGDPWIRSQMPMMIRGMCNGVDGLYIIDTVTHSYTSQTGIRTKILAKPPGGGDAEFDDELKATEGLNPKPGQMLGEYLIGPGGRVAGGV